MTYTSHIHAFVNVINFRSSTILQPHFVKFVLCFFPQKQNLQALRNFNVCVYAFIKRFICEFIYRCFGVINFVYKALIFHISPGLFFICLYTRHIFIFNLSSCSEKLSLSMTPTFDCESHNTPNVLRIFHQFKNRLKKFLDMMFKDNKAEFSLKFLVYENLL